MLKWMTLHSQSRIWKNSDWHKKKRRKELVWGCVSSENSNAAKHTFKCAWIKLTTCSFSSAWNSGAKLRMARKRTEDEDGNIHLQRACRHSHWKLTQTMFSHTVWNIWLQILCQSSVTMHGEEPFTSPILHPFFKDGLIQGWTLNVPLKTGNLKDTTGWDCSWHAAWVHGAVSVRAEEDINGWF